ncbi:unnamed protein product [Symbiodinium natans]|uniref:Uncharacterized protein n=1 Tax=Symbiodinium natans TaxID=878477 RepID=A0A812NP75_9DINO|nr:unnamed protein product [Symbiodinium natans]
MQLLVVSTPSGWQRGMPMLIMRCCGAALSTHCAWRHLLHRLRWYMHCIRYNSSLPKKDANALPNNTLVHLPWAWRIVTLADGYSPATVQEALLQYMVSLGKRWLRHSCKMLRRCTMRKPALLPRLQPPDPVAHALTLREHEPDPDTRFRYRASLANLDPFIAEDVLARPCCVFRAPPHFCKGVLRKALQVALELIRSCSRTANGADGIHLVRAWKLWLFLPRMLLHRPAGGARVGKPALLVRFQSFMQGDWALLLRDALLRPAPSSPWRAVGSATGAAPGPSGFTAEILRVVLDADDSTHAFADVASLFAQAQVPEDMRAALGLGRMVALRKPTGGTRGLVIGDFLRRLVAPTLAQQFAPSLEEACRPHQYALDNRAGLDALVHHVQPGARCALDPTLTVVGISRQATLHELRNLPEARGGCPTAVREVVAWEHLETSLTDVCCSRTGGSEGRRHARAAHGGNCAIVLPGIVSGAMRAQHAEEVIGAADAQKRQPGRLLSLGELQDPTKRRALVSGWLRRRAPATAQQRRGQGALQRATQLPPPPAFPPGAGSSSQRPRRAQGALLREVADEVVRLLPTSSADLHSQDDEALLRRRRRFQQFAPAPSLEGHAARARTHGARQQLASFRAADRVHLTAAELGEALRTAKRGSAAGLSGAAVEHYRLLLEDEEAMDLLAHAASLLANADAPAAVLQALALSRLTALSKPGGGVRGIATGDTLRRLVSRALARQHVVFFFLLAPFCIRRSQGRVGRVHGSPSRARGRDLGPAGQTAWCRDLALAPAGVSQELVQGWGCASSTGLKRDGELEVQM